MAIKYLKPSRTPEAGEDDVRQAVARMLREIEVGRGAKVLEYARQLGACRSNRDDSEKWDGQPTNGPIWATEEAPNRENRGRSGRSHRTNRSFSHFSDRLLVRLC